MYYISTRDKKIRLTASEAVLKGISDEGGLFVPEEIPSLDLPLDELALLNYREMALFVMKKFLTDYTEKELKDCIKKAYDEKFDTPLIAPLKVINEKTAYLELFHGKTIAFKDMALSILPHLLKCAAKKKGIKEEIVILTATSGDTGKAALAGFADVPGTRIIVFYPKDGVSPVQKLQMVTEPGKNTLVAAVEGNFDDCQTGVKKIFSDAALREKLLKKGFRFSSANSINIGRLVPQIVYYVYAYGASLRGGLIKAGDPINITVPTGNFGNILAAFYARDMGIPVNKLICASNENRVLFDFFNSGKYDRNREFILTSSPSMDILISSNLERLIFRLTGNDQDKTLKLMKALSSKGHYEITEEMKEKTGVFSARFATEKDTFEKIRSLYAQTGYVIDTHTAVGGFCLDKYREETGDGTYTVVASTASPFKFAESVISAINGKKPKGDIDALFNELKNLSTVDIPSAVKGLTSMPVLHKKTCDIAGMEGIVEGFLKKRS